VDIGLGFTQNIDWLYELRNLRAFVGMVKVGASVGNFSLVQLFNPVGSGITIVVRAIIISAAATDLYTINRDNVARASLNRVGFNLDGNGADAVGQIRFETPVGVVGSRLAQWRILANTSWIVSPDWMGKLNAGNGITINGETTNQEMLATFFWSER
jgi:hypothetical protein